MSVGTTSETAHQLKPTRGYAHQVHPEDIFATQGEGAQAWASGDSEQVSEGCQ
eukprot:SAG31_NODE_13164_length_888_cov_5.653992_2_plen_52_part_01